MMSSENIPPASGSNRKPSSSSSSAQQKAQPQEQQPQKCPRCDSSNTKFCYYNNYSLSQPRHFCKTCRRYWTKGGALRNVPIGGGCRKTKKLKPNPSVLSGGGGGGNDFAKFIGSTAAAPADFQLGGLSLPRLHPATAGVYTQFVSGGASSFGLDLFGMNTTSSSEADHQISLSSIESLSSMNQEMHWKLQQQRLALIYGNAPGSGCSADDDNLNLKQQKEMKPPTAMNLFQDLGINNNNNNENNSNHSKVTDAARGNNNGLTEWFFDQTNYGPTGNDESHMNGVHHGWGDLNHFNGLH